MKRVAKSVLLWYTPAEMFALVTAVERYPEFLPWCSSAEVLERREDGVTARLGLVYAGVRQSFTTRNVETPDAAVHLALVDGPFSTLEGDWRFLPIEQAGRAAACRVEFELRYAFASFALELLVSPVFDRISATFVDTFVERAAQVYGPR